MKNVLIAAAAVFAAIPGLAGILSGIGVPPDPPYPALFAAVSECLGALTLLLFRANRDKIQTVPTPRIVRLSVTFGILGVIAIAVYLPLYTYSVVNIPPNQPMFYPLVLSQKAQTQIDHLGGRSEAISRVGQGGPQTIVNREPTWEIPVTALVLLIVYEAVSLSLTSAFALAAFHQRFDMIDAGRSSRLNPPSPS